MHPNKDSSTTPKDLLNDLHALVADAEAMTADSLSEHSGDALHKLQARFAAAQERFSGLYREAKMKIVAGATYTDERIRSHPYEAIAIAGGIGLLVGVLLGRRGK
jgi:ElaB/YqjD/DUF883 family membrane-anchored ribosome-binding protein